MKELQASDSVAITTVAEDVSPRANRLVRLDCTQVVADMHESSLMVIEAIPTVS